jgi:hypothetical protein
MELVMQRKVTEETNAIIWTRSAKRCGMKTWQDYVSHEIDVSKEFDADSNFGRIQLVSNLVEQIHRYNALQQYSPKRHG